MIRDLTYDPAAAMAELLRCASIEDGQARALIEFDVPALRAILDYDGSVMEGPAPLYWSAGRGTATYSFGIDVDERSRRIVLVEFRLYGETIKPWPATADAAETRQGIPVIDTSAWAGGARFRDEPGAFLLQARGGDFRFEFASGRPALRIGCAPQVDFELDAEDRICAVVLRELRPEIVETLTLRYAVA